MEEIIISAVSMAFGAIGMRWWMLRPIKESPTALESNDGLSRYQEYKANH